MVLAVWPQACSGARFFTFCPALEPSVLRRGAEHSQENLPFGSAAAVKVLAVWPQACSRARFRAFCPAPAPSVPRREAEHSQEMTQPLQLWPGFCSRFLRRSDLPGELRGCSCAPVSLQGRRTILSLGLQEHGFYASPVDDFPSDDFGCRCPICNSGHRSEATVASITAAAPAKLVALLEKIPLLKGASNLSIRAPDVSKVTAAEWLQSSCGTNTCWRFCGQLQSLRFTLHASPQGLADHAPGKIPFSHSLLPFSLANHFSSRKSSQGWHGYSYILQQRRCMCTAATLQSRSFPKTMMHNSMCTCTHLETAQELARFRW